MKFDNDDISDETVQINKDTIIHIQKLITSIQKTNSLTDYQLELPSFSTLFGFGHEDVHSKFVQKIINSLGDIIFEDYNDTIIEELTDSKNYFPRHRLLQFFVTSGNKLEKCHIDFIASYHLLRSIQIFPTSPEKIELRIKLVYDEDDVHKLTPDDVLNVCRIKPTPREDIFNHLNDVTKYSLTRLTEYVDFDKNFKPELSIPISDNLFRQCKFVITNDISHHALLKLCKEKIIENFVFESNVHGKGMKFEILLQKSYNNDIGFNFPTISNKL